MSFQLKLSNEPNAKKIVFVTIGELATLAGRTKESLKKLTDRGILPESNYRTRKGYRLYSKEFLVPRLVPYLKKIKQGVEVTPDQRVDLKVMFTEERSHYKN